MSLSNMDAFRAMFYFLDAYNKRGTSLDDIEILLSDISLLNDNSTADPAQWEDWLDAIKKLETNCRDEYLDLE